MRLANLAPGEWRLRRARPTRAAHTYSPGDGVALEPALALRLNLPVELPSLSRISSSQRTDELGRSVGELRALGEVTQAVNSTVDLGTVLTTIVAKATQLSSTEAGAIYVFDDAHQEFRLRATYGLDDTVATELRNRHIRIGEGAISDAVERRMPIEIPDIQNDPSATLDIIIRAGFRALLIVPLLSTDRTVGALVVRRKQPGEFPKSTIELPGRVRFRDQADRFS